MANSKNSQSQRTTSTGGASNSAANRGAGAAQKTRGAQPQTANGATPEKRGRVRQMIDVFHMTRKEYPFVPWLMLGALVVVTGIFVLVGILIHHWIYLGVMGLMFGILAALFLMTRYTERAAYARIEGQPGAALAAMSTIRRGWTIEQEPVAVDPRTRDMVFRAVGRAGVALVTEGPATRVKKLLDAEKKKVTRLLPNVPVTTFVVGDGEGQTPLRKLPMAMQKLKPTLTKQEMDAVTKRLKAMGGVRLPVPKGIDPTRARPDRKATRGR